MIHQNYVYLSKSVILKKFPGPLLCKTTFEQFNEETADQEEIGNGGIDIVVYRMLGDIAILYTLQYIDF